MTNVSNYNYPEKLDLDGLPKCPICTGCFSYHLSFHDVLFNPHKSYFNFYRCGRCYFLKIFPEPTFNETISFYPEDYYSYQGYEAKEETTSFAHKFISKLQDTILDLHYNKKSSSGLFLRSISWLFRNSILCIPLKQPKGDGMLLDVGSGSGYWIEKLSKYSWNCKGIDIVGKKSDKNIIGNFLEVSFESKFEYIRVHGVIEHVIDPDKYIMKISELLEENGECHISTPNSNCLSFKIFKKYWIGLEVPRHLQVFNDQNLILLLKKHNLEVIGRSSELSSGAFISCIYVYLRDEFGIAPPHPNVWCFLVIMFLPLDFFMKWINQSVNMVVIVNKKNNRQTTSS